MSDDPPNKLAVVKSIAVPVPGVVQALEEHLAAAKRGEYVAVAIIAIYPDMSQGTEMTRGYTNAMRGAVSYLLHRLNLRSDEE